MNMTNESPISKLNMSDISKSKPEFISINLKEKTIHTNIVNESRDTEKVQKVMRKTFHYPRGNDLNKEDKEVIEERYYEKKGSPLRRKSIQQTKLKNLLGDDIIRRNSIIEGENSPKRGKSRGNVEEEKPKEGKIASSRRNRPQTMGKIYSGNFDAEENTEQDKNTINVYSLFASRTRDKNQTKETSEYENFTKIPWPWGQDKEREIDSLTTKQSVERNITEVKSPVNRENSQDKVRDFKAVSKYRSRTVAKISSVTPDIGIMAQKDNSSSSSILLQKRKLKSQKFRIKNSNSQSSLGINHLTLFQDDEEKNVLSNREIENEEKEYGRTSISPQGRSQNQWTFGGRVIKKPSKTIELDEYAQKCEKVEATEQTFKIHTEKVVSRANNEKEIHL